MVFVVMGTGNDRSLRPRIRLLPRLVLLLTAIAVPACGAAGVPASVAGHPSATAAVTRQASTRARAETELANLLAMVRVPSTADELTSAPVAYLAQPPVTEGSPNLLIRTAWWLFDMPFADALAWMRSNAPGGLQSDSGGQAGGPGVPENRLLGFSVRSTTAYDGAEIELELVAISASETGLRADAEVIWLPPKPSDEFVPAGTAVTLVAINDFGSTDATTLRTKHLNAADAATTISDLNALLPSDGGVRGCAADSGYRVQIEVTVAGTSMVFSDWPACSLVQVTRGGSSLLTLSPTTSFQGEITRLIGSPPSL